MEQLERERFVAEVAVHLREQVVPMAPSTYDTTGALRAIPESYAFPDLDEARGRLSELPVVERHGLIWRLPSGWHEADLIESLGHLDAELAAYRAESYVLERTELIEQPFNWKFAIDGFLETYHFRFLHSKTIAPFIRGNYGPTTTYGHNIRMMALRSSYIPEVAEASEFVDPMPHVAGVYILFPNTVFVWQGDHLEVWRMYPHGDDPGRSIMTASLLSPKATETEAEQQHWDRNEPALQAFHRSLASLCGSEVR